MTLNNDNYYSAQANATYMSVSQFKSFAGTTAHKSCEETALKIFKNEITQESTTALLVGSYIDAYFEGKLDEFRADHPDIFKKTGDKGLKADYINAENIIARINADPVFTDYMSGQHQTIMTGDLFGIPWKIKMDSYHPNDKIVDLKIMKDMNAIYSPLLGRKTDFITYWGYDIQGAIYQKIVELNTGNKLPFYIACATKEDTPNIEIIEITQPHLDSALTFVEKELPRVLGIKYGTITPVRCGICNACKASKMINRPITIDDLIKSQNIPISSDGANNTDNMININRNTNSSPIGLFD